jgi:hypothetical protein
VTSSLLMTIGGCLFLSSSKLRSTCSNMHKKFFPQSYFAQVGGECSDVAAEPHPHWRHRRGARLWARAHSILGYAQPCPRQGSLCFDPPPSTPTTPLTTHPEVTTVHDCLAHQTECSAMKPFASGEQVQLLLLSLFFLFRPLRRLCFLVVGNISLLPPPSPQARSLSTTALAVWASASSTEASFPAPPKSSSACAWESLALIHCSLSAHNCFRDCSFPREFHVLMVPATS